MNGGELLVQILVRNTGREYAGREVAQVYVSAPSGSIPKPRQELRGFAKTRLLQPGEEETLQIRLHAASLASFSPKCPARSAARNPAGPPPRISRS